MKRPRLGARKTFIIVLGGFFGLPLWGCSPAAARHQSVPASASVVLTPKDRVAHIYRALENNTSDSARLVIRDQETLDDFAEHSGIPKTDLPTGIDFASDEVIVAAMGGQASLGPTIDIDSVADVDDERIVIVRQTLPAPGCLLPSAYTHPLDVVLVHRRSGRRVRFLERIDKLRDCRMVK
jgi:hypothetical protein